MKAKMLWMLVSGILLAALLVSLQPLLAEEPKVPAVCVDKALCAEMIRFGKEAYQRGKYLDAKEYFRKAVQADPASAKAWAMYDMAAVFALAEKVEQNTDLIMPGVSTRTEAGSAAKAPPPAAPAKKKPTFKIVDDEGC